MTELGDALSIFIGWVSEPDFLAVLSSCSKELRDNCTSVVRQRIKSILPRVVMMATTGLQAAQAAVITAEVQAQRASMLGWLCSVAGPEAIGSGWKTSAAAIISISDVPWRVAKPMVAAGVRLTLLQLEKACVKQVAGVEVWVKACEALSLNSGLPDAEQAICCDKTDELRLALAEEGISVLPEGPAAERIIYLLQIALNMKSSEAAEYILSTYKDMLKAAIHREHMRELLRTAIRRTRMDWVMPSDCAGDLDGFTETSVGNHSVTYFKGYSQTVVHTLCSFPAAQELTAEDVIELMGLAIRHAPQLISSLPDWAGPLPGTRNITEQGLDGLLLESIGFHDDTTLRYLSKLSVAIDPDTLLTVLSCACEVDDRLKYRLDGLDARQTAALMIAFLQHPEVRMWASGIVDGDGANLMSPEQWLDVLTADTVASDYHGAPDLEECGCFARAAWRVPAVQQLDRAAVSGLLKQAVLLGWQGYLSDDFMKLLAPEQAPDAGTLNDLLQTALRHQNLKMLTHMCQQQWAQSLQQVLATESAALDVMTAAQDAGDASGSSDCESPQANQLLQAAMQGEGVSWQRFGVDPLEVKLHRALVKQDFDNFLGLCKQATIRQLCPQGVVTLLAAAVAIDPNPPVPAAVLEAIHSLLLQAEVDVSTCETAQLHVAIQLQRDALAAALCRLHNPQLSPEQSEDLLRRAAQMNCHQTVAELCGQAAFRGAIGCKAVYRLLLLTTACFTSRYNALSLPREREWTVGGVEPMGNHRHTRLPPSTYAGVHLRHLA